MKLKRYNDGFKQTIDELYRSGTSVGALHRKYGVSEVTIYQWIKSFTPVDGDDGLTPAEIKKENLRLKQEVEILKKAMTQAAIEHLFSWKGCPYDNACIESFHAILKKEEIHDVVHPTPLGIQRLS